MVIDKSMMPWFVATLRHIFLSFIYGYQILSVHLAGKR